MKLARAETADGVVTGEIRDGELVTDGGRYEEHAYDLLAPCEPSALFCVGRNYGAKVEQMDYDVPAVPDFFIKPPVSVHPPGRPIEYPRWTNELTYAGELAAVIGTACHQVSEAEAGEYVRGYTVLNDMDALDQERRTARKAFDASGPLGPWIETDVDPTAIEMETYVGGERRQSASTAEMFFSPHEVVAFLSERFTLAPGDVISFGSPANPGLVDPGDEVAITYEGVGTLRNRIVAP